MAQTFEVAGACAVWFVHESDFSFTCGLMTCDPVLRSQEPVHCALDVNQTLSMN